MVRRLIDGADVQRGMLAQLSARLRARQAAGGGGGGEGEGEGDGVPIMVDDNCEVSLETFCPMWTLRANEVPDHVEYSEPPNHGSIEMEPACQERQIFLDIPPCDWVARSIRCARHSSTLLFSSLPPPSPPTHTSHKRIPHPTPPQPIPSFPSPPTQHRSNDSAPPPPP